MSSSNETYVKSVIHLSVTNACSLPYVLIFVGWVAQDEKRQTPAEPAYSSLSSKGLDIIDTAEAIGKKHGRSIAEVALRWLLQKDVTTSIIIGATSLAQLDQNMAINDWSLSAKEMNQLDEVSAPDVPYPYYMVFKLNKDRVNTRVNDYFVKSLDS
ncbi:4-deoxy-l-erythro-5-hexoseulose uronic acid reductase [Plakobranchus ocellatus]|uniref:4-deoxy-l-erythro-5-hexoseulose uronic acid reductase n=1 Tax=Plakobranchus ocellatus TaxID=259542 RepID=A0AAV4BQ63_9GAST|nr:4-deoxy-l-erythro-5-hexoseulose uronic acid reductase [Plakobranchus ocellatus]